MPHSAKSDQELARRLAELCRLFAQQRAKLAQTDQEMKEVASEIAKRHGSGSLADGDRSDSG